MLNPKPIPLNSGLDTVTPAIMQEGGALLACMNYEMTGTVGYRRLDGFESYDGWANGDIANYYTVPVTITDGAITATLIPGATLTAVNTDNTVVVIGTIVNYSGGIITYVSFNPDYVIIPNATSLDTDFTAPGRMTSTAVSSSGIVVDAPDTFVANLRSYSAVLRALVQQQAANVCGTYWFRNNAVVAIDAPVLTYTDAVPADVGEGGLIAYGGITYRIINRAYNGTTNIMTLHLEPVQTNGFTASNVYSVDSGGATTLLSVTSPVVTTGASDYSYLSALRNPETSSVKGNTLLKRSHWLSFTNGTAFAETLMQKGEIVSIGTGGALYVQGYVNQLLLLSGTFAAGSAAGWIEVIVDTTLNKNGPVNYISTAYDLYNFGAVTKLADITEVFLSKLPGSKALRTSKTRFQWESYNFYGQSDTLRMYGATGASHAFWANAHSAPLTSDVPPSVVYVSTLEYSWGSILDRLDFPSLTYYPKYVALHGRVQLALGLPGGSVFLSVIGEPLNYNGVLGALEIATGDDLTGLLEGAGDSTVVFGKSSIRRVIGTTDADISVQTISGNAGALDYTCVLVGASPVFANSSGITSLEQTNNYGDFQGLRSTYRVSNTLPFELVRDRSDSETGGAAMALPVRTKDQYRLFLKSGKVVTVTFTGDGAKIMESNYGAKWAGDYDIRVPLAWGSSVSDSGKENILIAWDDELARRQANTTGAQGTVIPDPRTVYQLDRGWGFDGVRFPHNFDISHVFERGGTHYINVAKVRAYGKGYGLSSLNLKAAGIEGDFDVAYHSRIQDISLPRNLDLMTPAMRNVTNIVDSANRGLGIKLGIYGTELTPTQTEPSHVIQVLVCDIAEGGQLDG